MGPCQHNSKLPQAVASLAAVCYGTMIAVALQLVSWQRCLRGVGQCL